MNPQDLPWQVETAESNEGYVLRADVPDADASVSIECEPDGSPFRVVLVGLSGGGTCDEVSLPEGTTLAQAKRTAIDMIENYL